MWRAARSEDLQNSDPRNAPMKSTPDPMRRSFWPLTRAVSAVIVTFALGQGALVTAQEPDSTPAPAGSNQDGKLPVPPVTASMRMEADPAFTAPPEEIPAVEGAELTSFLHSSGAVARKGYLKDGARVGLWISWHANGRRATLGAYSNYKRVGPWVITKPDGTKVEGQYDAEGRRQGLWRTYAPNGSLRLRAFWKDDLRTNIFERFYPSGLRAAFVTYSGGLRNGQSTKYNMMSGLPLEQGSWSGGREDGPWRTWHKNGQLSSEGAYERGRKVGPWVEYHDNGRRYRVGSYVNGVQSGEWVGYFKRGEREFVGTFKGGVLDGPYVGFWPSGDKRGEGSYSKGVFEGPWKFWGRDGQVDPAQTGTYRGGDLIR